MQSNLHRLGSSAVQDAPALDNLLVQALHILLGLGVLNPRLKHPHVLVTLRDAASGVHTASSGSLNLSPEAADPLKDAVCIHRSVGTHVGLTLACLLHRKIIIRLHSLCTGVLAQVHQLGVAANGGSAAQGGRPRGRPGVVGGRHLLLLFHEALLFKQLGEREALGLSILGELRQLACGSHLGVLVKGLKFHNNQLLHLLRGPLARLRQAVPTLNAVDDVRDGGVQVRALLDDLHVGLELHQAGVQRTLAGVEDKVPAIVIELKMLQEELKHGIVTAGPDQVHTTRLLLGADHGQCGGDTNATGY
mmetsp:Transcript_28716/g.80836  ORF Transcript_28716/g.80836 Transcript_28716/m.80836 type:complete len:305 (-) Transcript_28716:1245-2159(-)